MDARLRLTFFCGTCLGLAVGFAAGHVSIWQRFSANSPSNLSLNAPFESEHSASMGAGGFDILPMVPAPESHEATHVPIPGGAVVLNDPEFGDEPVHADALVELPSTAPEPVSGPTPPNSLPVASSKPLTQSTSNTLTEPATSVSNTQQAQAVSSVPAKLDPEVVEMLKDELEGVSEQQREVWADALQGMSPADAAGIILMWKKFGQTAAGPQHMSSPPPLFRSSHPDAAPTPLHESGAPHSALPTPTDEEDLGIRITQHNQANRETCGYLEMIPLLREVAFDQVDGRGHVQIIGYRLDIEPGRHVETGNPSHVAVQRGCFFAVKLPTGEEQYTRVGRLVLDAERRLCIDLGDSDLPITPEVKLPEGATRFLVQSGQLRVEIEGQPEPATVGPLQVAEFFDASRLLPVGGSLYNASTASGKPKMVAAELILQTLEYPSIDGGSQSAGTSPIGSKPIVITPRE